MRMEKHVFIDISFTSDQLRHLRILIEFLIRNFLFKWIITVREIQQREYENKKTKEDGIEGTWMCIYTQNRIPFQRTISNHTLENVIKIYRVMAIRTKRFLPFIRYAR